jgi:predicted ATPase
MSEAFVPEQPSGTVTLAFTDIEGSTRLLHELGQDAYREALARHREIVREAFAAHAGYEVDYEGDSFFYAFESAADAVDAVEEAMAGLASGPIRIRVGVHTGEPGLDPPKYVGLDVHLAARVMSVGHGGQVLLTRATRDLLDAELVDLGEHRLKDIVDPVWLYQLGRGVFPPLKSLNNTNLPTPASSFLGRESELDEADRLIADCRLLTVSGPGGAGKTRFAIELASRQLPRFPNGVFWVPLAALRDPGLVMETISQAVGSPNGLADHIRTRRILLLLDNLEQVIACAPQLSQLLSECPLLSLLVTSRELLRVQGEVDYPLPPLAERESVELFCTRAGHDPGESARELCRRLEGLPLAIELAAARMRVFTVEQVLDRLGNRLDLLRGGRDADPRQQTLRATIQWSYDLLGAGEASLFRRLAVFAGGCTLVTAEAVCGAEVDRLQALVEKSLVRHTHDRFWMLETIRELALDELETRGELDRARAAYFDWMLRLAEQAEPELEGRNQNDWLERLHAEHENIREVVTLALDDDPAAAIRILVGFDRYWFIRPGEAMGWFDAALAMLDRVPPDLAGHALRVAATTAWFYGRPELTLQHCRKALEIFEPLGDERGMSLTYSRIAPPLIEVEGNLDEAEEILLKAIDMHRRLGQTGEVAIALSIVGSVNYDRGDLAGARAKFEESIALGREVGDLHMTARVHLMLGSLMIEQGEIESGVAEAQEALRIAWAQRNLIDVCMDIAAIAEACSAAGDAPRAATLWGAVERLDAALGPSQFRTPKEPPKLVPAVLEDTASLAAGHALTTAEAVELALSIDPAVTNLS